MIIRKIDAQEPATVKKLRVAAYQRFVFQLHSRRHLRNVHTEVNAHKHKSPVGAEHMHCSGEHRTADIYKGENVL